ncbi:MAG: hypothetical protein Kow0059_00920 [Candidatus Sumerlaeia bacterium]
MGRPKSDTQTPELLAITADAVKELDDCLDLIVQNSAVRCALLIDKTGAIISRSGTFDAVAPEITAAVTVATYTALQSLTRATEADELSIKFYGKKFRKLYIARVYGRIYLTAIYDEQTSATKIRSVARPLIRKMAEALAADQPDQTTLHSITFIQEKLSEIFKNG